MPRVEVIYKGITDYDEILVLQEKYFEELLTAKKSGKAGTNRIILCQHPHVYTIGRGGSKQNMLISGAALEKLGARLAETGRGGDITYHGPGQLVGYPILDLEQFRIGVKEYINKTEEAVILTLAHWNIVAGRLEGAAGVWLGRQRKICAIGVKVSRFVTMHGFALNVSTDLGYFGYINPCGFTDKAVTSMEKETGSTIPMKEVEDKFISCFADVFAAGME